METTYEEDMLELLDELEAEERIIPENGKASKEFIALAILKIIPQLASVDFIFHDFPDAFSDDIKERYKNIKYKMLNKLDDGVA